MHCVDASKLDGKLFSFSGVIMRSKTAVYFLLVLLAGVLLLGVACTKAASDSELTSQVQSKFKDDSGLQGKSIAVETANGVVTLSGTVDNDAERTAAARYASSVPGIKQVVNNLQVDYGNAATPAEQEAPPEPVRREPKPTPNKPSHRTAPRSSAMAEAAPAPAMTAAQDETPAPTPAPPAAAAAAPAPPPPPKKVSIPAGTSLAIRLVDEIDSETAQAGQTFKATLDSSLSVDGEVAVPAGYDVEGHVVDVKSAGKFAGKSELVLQLDRIVVGGKTYSIQTDEYRREGSSRGKNTAAKVGTGAAIGAIIGGIAGGGKGAAIGAAAGGGIGGGVQAATKGQQIKLPTETVLNFSLQSPVTVTPTTEGPHSGRKKLETPQ
jgi:outer membrane biosynthesis protein TonB